LLVRRSKSAPRRPLEWDLPGGFVDEGDVSYQQACLRELTEETGLTALDGTYRLAYTESALSSSDDGETYDVSWLYFTVKTAMTDVTLSYEHDEFTRVSLDDALGLIRYDKQLRALAYILRVCQAQ
jgi:8-oxo-dGTP pyrophosphatase MutT (NUDIX family)